MSDNPAPRHCPVSLSLGAVRFAIKRRLEVPFPSILAAGTHHEIRKGPPSLLPFPWQSLPQVDSSEDKAPYGTATLTEDLRGLMDALNIKKGSRLAGIRRSRQATPRVHERNVRQATWPSPGFLHPTLPAKSEALPFTADSPMKPRSSSKQTQPSQPALSKNEVHPWATAAGVPAPASLEIKNVSFRVPALPSRSAELPQ